MTDTTQQWASEKALAAKREGAVAQEHLRRKTKTPTHDPIAEPHDDAPVDGAFGAEGHRPLLERSMKVR